MPKKYYAVRNNDEVDVCIVDKKPTWKLFDIRQEKEWIFKDKGFWKDVHIDVFKKLTGLTVKEGKDGLIEVPESKMDLIKKL